MLSFGILRIWWLNYHCVVTSPPWWHHHHDHALNKSSDDGEYTCWSGSQQSKAAKLTVQAPPGVPHIRFLCWSSRCWSEIHTIIWAEWKQIDWYDMLIQAGAKWWLSRGDSRCSSPTWLRVFGENHDHWSSASWSDHWSLKNLMFLV